MLKGNGVKGRIRKDNIKSEVLFISYYHVVGSHVGCD